MLRNSSRACKEAAAVTTVWVCNTHHSLQRQEFRWEWIKQEVREQKTELRCMQNNQGRYEERLRQLENLVCKQERALVEQGSRCESMERERRLGVCLAPKIEGQGAGGRAPGHVAPLSDAARGKIGRSATPGWVKRQLDEQSGRGQVAPQLQELVIRRGIKLEGSNPERQGVSNQEGSKVGGVEEDPGAVPKAVSLEASPKAGRLLDILSKGIDRPAWRTVEVTSVSPITHLHQQGAGGVEVAPRLSTVGTPLPLSTTLKEATRAVVKRKADTQKRVGFELDQSQGPRGGKRARKLENPSASKRVSFRKILPKEDSYKQVRETRSLQEQGKIPPGGGAPASRKRRVKGRSQNQVTERRARTKRSQESRTWTSCPRKRSPPIWLHSYPGMLK